MIEALRLTRFRGFEDSGWVELAPLTLLFGHNSSGKSSILSSLLMLRQSVLNPDRTTQFVLTSDLGVDLGSYEDLVHGHKVDERRPMSISVRLQLDDPYVGWSRPIFTVVVRLRIGSYRKRTYLAEIAYLDAESERSLLRVRPPRPLAASTTPGEVTSDTFGQELLPEYKDITWQHFLPFLQLSQYLSRSVAELCEQIARQLEDDLRSIVHIGPLRTEPARFYYFSGESVGEVGSHGENTYKLLAALRFQRQHHKIEDQLGWWLSQLGYDLDVQTLRDSPLLQIAMREHNDGNKDATAPTFNLKDVGFGLSQVLPILVQCYTKPARLILIEQPEIHLHPRAQAALGDLLIDALKMGHQFVVETHSEHLLLRLRRRIAEKTAQIEGSAGHPLNAEQLGVYFMQRESGRSIASRVPIDERGQVPEPPQGFEAFFSDDFEEMVKIVEAGGTPVAIGDKA